MDQILDVITKLKNKGNKAAIQVPSETLIRGEQLKGVDLKTLVLASLGNLVPETSVENLRYEESVLLDYKSRLIKVGRFDLCLKSYLAAPDDKDKKLLELANAYQLGTEELLAIGLCIAVEEDPLIGTCLAYLQNNTKNTRPTLGLLQQALTVFSAGTVKPLVSAILASGNALKSDILMLNNQSEPLPNQTLAVPVALVLAMSNYQANFASAYHLHPSEKACLTASIKNTANTHARSLVSEQNSLLKIRSGFPLERKQVAVYIAESMSQTALLFSGEHELPPGIGPYCFLANCVPVFEFNLGPNEKQRLPAVRGYSGSVICLLGVDGDLEGESDSVLEWNLGVPDAADRKEVWKKYVTAELAEFLGGRYIHGAGRIAQLSAVALREARRFAREPLIEDIHKAAWNTDNGGLDSLAQPIYDQIGDEGLVLTSTIQRQMKSLYLRCMTRELLDENLGVSVRQRYHCGVKAMMVGPSGTGKTLSAAWLATRLGLPLYRVDIASIVSKYIGETEKNLSSLMEKAENSDVILLFDEADALFGKRTDVKDSSDRFANSQTNYLLQRIENYRGIVLLTSNSRSRIDQAFLRRIDYIIEFSNPSAEERRLLWRVHLGEKHGVAARDVNKIAVKCELGGGHIRNAVLTAAVHAKESDRKINYQDLLEGVACEYRKLGKQPPLALN